MKHTLAFYTEAFVLVEEWKTTSLLGVLTAMLASCAVSSLYEWLSRFLYSWDNKPHQICTGHRYQEMSLRSLRSAMHALSACTSYVLMLFLMTYNVWVMISILIGSATGYFFLGPKINPERLPRVGTAQTRNVSNRDPSPNQATMEIDKETEIPLATACSVSEQSDNPDNKDVNSAGISNILRSQGASIHPLRDFGGEEAEETEDLLAGKDDEDIM